MPLLLSIAICCYASAYPSALSVSQSACETGYAPENILPSALRPERMIAGCPDTCVNCAVHHPCETPRRILSIDTGLSLMPDAPLFLAAAITMPPKTNIPIKTNSFIKLGNVFNFSLFYLMLTERSSNLWLSLHLRWCCNMPLRCRYKPFRLLRLRS